MTTNEDLTRLFKDRIHQEPAMTRARRVWLLWLRTFWDWRAQRHNTLAGQCYKRREYVLIELAEMDEVGKGLW